MVRVYPDGETPSAIRVEFVPREPQAVKQPGGLPKRVPSFLARARLEDGTIVTSWQCPPPEDYKVDPEELQAEAVERLNKRLDWLDRLSRLIDTVEGWALALGWSTKRMRKELKDFEIGAYQTDVLLLQQETTRVLLEPVGSASPDSEGVVDLYLLPAYDDIATLYYYDHRWNLHDMTSGASGGGKVGQAESKPLSKTSLRKVLEEMKQNVA
jgi:hypothetical protein